MLLSNPSLLIADYFVWHENCLLRILLINVIIYWTMDFILLFLPLFYKKQYARYSDYSIIHMIKSLWRALQWITANMLSCSQIKVQNICWCNMQLCWVNLSEMIPFWCMVQLDLLWIVGSYLACIWWCCTLTVVLIVYIWKFRLRILIQSTIFSPQNVSELMCSITAWKCIIYSGTHTCSHHCLCEISYWLCKNILE